MTNSTTVKSRKHEDVKGVGEKKLGDPFKTASEKFHRRQAQMKQPVAEACSDQRDDHPTDERRVCSGLSPSPCASASLMLQCCVHQRASLSNGHGEAALRALRGTSRRSSTARKVKAKQHCA